MKFNLADELFIEKRPAANITIADFHTYSTGTTRAAAGCWIPHIFGQKEGVQPRNSVSLWRAEYIIINKRVTPEHLSRRST
jgi:hypothetical protein